MIDNSWLKEGKLIWVEQDVNNNSDIFIPATLKTFDQQLAYFSLPNGKSGQKKLNLIFERASDQRNEDQQELTGYGDMVDMEIINDAELLNNIRLRYRLDLICTYVGPTLLVVNPFQPVPKLFNPDLKKHYIDQIIKARIRYKSLPPHVYAVAAEAYRCLFDSNKNQSLVISGESGAGKTENARFCMNIITSIGQQQERKQEQVSIEDKILGCNPILEAFGNAKTLRNNNSSRFGKYVRMMVDKQSEKITGAQIINYLLEKSRVTNHAKGERSFHIFYHLLMGEKQETLQKYYLANVSFGDFEYLKSADKADYTVKAIDDVKLYKEVMDSANVLDMKSDFVDIVGVLSSVLHLGNIQYDDSTLGNNTSCTIKQQDSLKAISEMLGLKHEDVSQLLTFKTITIGKETILSPLSLLECAVTRESWAKELYDRTFSFIVERLNSSIYSQSASYLGLLDIYGFEVFEKNGFEQMMINYTNEKLHQLYILYVFKEEKQIFIREGLEDYSNLIIYTDNTPIIELFDKNGIFSLIDENCRIKNADDNNLISKIKKNFAGKKGFAEPRMPSSLSFIVRHTAKDVEYGVTGFIDKNRDEISSLIEQICCKAANKLIAKLFEKQSSGPKDKSLCIKIKKQMADLMDELTSCELHFIRCIKPNDDKMPQKLVQDYALTQIRYLGVLDSLKVRKESYPVRRTYQTFFKAYGDISNEKPYPILEQEKADFREISLKQEIYYLRQQAFQRAFQLDLSINGKYKDIYEDDFNPSVRRYLQGEDSEQKCYGLQDSKSMESLQAAKDSKEDVCEENEDQVPNKDFSEEDFKKQINQISYKNLKVVPKNDGRKKKKTFQNLNSNLLISDKKIYRYPENQQYKKKAGKNLKIWTENGSFITIKKTNVLQKAAIELFRERMAKNLNEGCNYNPEIRKRIYYKKKLEKADLPDKRSWVKIQYYVQSLSRKAKIRKVAVKIQKTVRGYLIRKRYGRMKSSAFYIQGFFKMRWLSDLFQAMRAAIVIIQQRVRTFLATRKALRDKYRKYIIPWEQELSSQKIKEEHHMFGFSGDKNPLLETPHKDNPSSTTMSPFVQPIQLSPQPSFIYQRSSSPNKNQQSSSPSKNQLENFETILNVDHQHSAKKLIFFAFIIDLEIFTDTQEIYDPSFALNYRKLFNSAFSNGQLLQTIHVGESHSVATSALGKIYSWGLNDQGQLGRGEEKEQKRHKPFPINFPHRIKQISAGANHTLAITQDGQLYGWGSNGSFQLDYATNLPFCNPVLLEYFDNDTIRYVKAAKNASFAVTQEGKVFTWPVSDSLNFLPNPMELNVPQPIQKVSCGQQFAILLSINGLMYSFGENDHGQLGIGNLEMRVQPTLIPFGEKVVSVQCGQKHSACFTSLHRIYTWGWGEHGQLGNDQFKDSLAPQNVYTANCLSISCGPKSTIVIIQNKRVLWCGSNGTISYQNSFVDFKVEAKCLLLSEQYFSPIRVISSYSQSLSIIYITYVQHKGMWDRNPSYCRGVIQQIANKWIENDSYVDPPQIETLAKFISEKHQKRSDKTIGRKSNYFHQPSVGKFPIKSRSEVMQPPTFSNLHEQTSLNSKRSELKLRSPPQAVKVDDLIRKQLIGSEPYPQFGIFDRENNASSDQEYEEEQQYQGVIDENKSYKFEQISEHSDEHLIRIEPKYQKESKQLKQEILIEEYDFEKDQMEQQELDDIKELKQLQNDKKIEPLKESLILVQSKREQKEQPNKTQEIKGRKKSKSVPKKVLEQKSKSLKKIPPAPVQQKVASHQNQKLLPKTSSKKLNQKPEREAKKEVPRKQNSNYFSSNAKEQQSKSPLKKEESRSHKKSGQKQNEIRIKTEESGQADKSKNSIQEVRQFESEPRNIASNQETEQKIKRLREIKNRLIHLKQIPESEWKNEDSEFLQNIYESNLTMLLDSLV